MAEEDALLFPIFAEHWPRETALLYADHDVFRNDFRRYGRIVDVERLQRHSAMEDALALRLTGPSSR